jgi:hypothetical protein
MTPREYLPGILILALGGAAIAAFSAGPRIYEARIGDSIDAILFVGLPIGVFVGGIIYGIAFDCDTAKDDKLE